MKTILTTLILLESFFVSFGQWKQSNGPYGGISRAILFKGADVFAASSGGGIFRSTNNGTIWKPCNKGLTNFTVGALALSGNNLFAGTDGAGIFVSTDNGNSWTHAITGVTNQYVRSLAANDTIVFAGSGSGVFRSNNNGASWTSFSNGLTTSDVRALLIVDTLVFAATYGGGIFRSGIKGNNWKAINTGVTSSYIYSLAYHDSTIFAASGNKGIFISTSNGDSWTTSDEANNGLENDWVNALTAAGTKVFAATYTGVSVSENNGLTWTTVNSGLIYKDVRALAYNGSLLFGGTNDGGVYLSQNNGLQWTLCGLQNTFATSFTAVGNSVFSGVYGNYGVHKTTDLGNSWTPLYNGFKNHAIKSLTHVDSILYAGTDGGGLYVSHDFGSNWVACDSGFSGIYFYCNALASSGTKIYAGTNEGMYTSNNLGLSWDSMFNGLSNKDIRSIAADGLSLYAGTKGGGFYIYNTTTSLWSQSNSGLSDLNVFSICINGSSIFIGTGSGLYVSTNGGISWTTVTNGIQNIYVYAIAYSGNYMFAGTQYGVYFSKDNGTTWVFANTGIDGIASKDTRALIINGTTVFAGMYEGAVWTRNISDFLTGIKDTSEGNTNISIYPNPALDIIYLDNTMLNTDALVNIYNTMGKLVLSTNLKPDQHWINIEDIRNGLYLLEIKSKDTSTNQKLIIQK